VDNPSAFVTKIEYLVAEWLKSPDPQAVLLQLVQSPQVRRFCELVARAIRPELVSPDSGTCVSQSGSTNVVIVVGNPAGSYTINIVDATGTVVHSCASVPINPANNQGTCTIPPGTLPAGENFTIEVVSGGTSFSTVGWFCTT
jgi:hypothetical protein